MNVSQWKILVVEDTADDAEMVSKILRFHGAQVFLARDGAECIDMLHEVDPNLVVMDLAMPRMDGWQTLSAIRAADHTAHIPVVATTAYYSFEMEQNTLAAGFNAYFEKPMNPRSFVQRLADLLDGD